MRLRDYPRFHFSSLNHRVLSSSVQVFWFISSVARGVKPTMAFDKSWLYQKLLSEVGADSPSLFFYIVKTPETRASDSHSVCLSMENKTFSPNFVSLCQISHVMVGKTIQSSVVLSFSFVRIFDVNVDLYMSFGLTSKHKLWLFSFFVSRICPRVNTRPAMDTEIHEHGLS